MVSLTENEATMMEFLLRNFSRDYSINELARELGLSPGGAHKILKKLEGQGFLKSKEVGNSIIYKIDFSSEDALDACKFALSGREVGPYLEAWIKDLERLKPKTELAILFGSILEKGKEARDVDVLLVFPEERVEEIEGAIEKLNRIKSKRAHAVYQTKEDLVKNIKERDEAVLEEIRTGIVLWGKGRLVEAIRDGES